MIICKIISIQIIIIIIIFVIWVWAIIIHRNIIGNIIIDIIGIHIIIGNIVIVIIVINTVDFIELIVHSIFKIAQINQAVIYYYIIISVDFLIGLEVYGRELLSSLDLASIAIFSETIIQVLAI